MALYSYKKAPVKTAKKAKHTPTVGEMADSFIANIVETFSKVKLLSIVIPIVFIASGTSILYNQIRPYALHFIQSNFSNRLNQEIIPLVPDSYDKIRAAYISDPGAKYFSQLMDKNKKSSPSQEILSYEGVFFLTIESISIDRAPITANVDSYDIENYEAALSQGLAHFKGSYLPGDEGNVFIYGHSAAGDYADRNPSDVVTSFTRLFKLNIGDTFTIEFENTEYNYVIKKVKEVSPEETDVLYTQGGNTVTLMTCSPPGLNTRRLIVVATEQ